MEKSLEGRINKLWSDLRFVVGQKKQLFGQENGTPPLLLTGQTRHRQGRVSKIAEMRHQQGGCQRQGLVLMQNVIPLRKMMSSTRGGQRQGGGQMKHT